jgi:DMSO/TMAO reductase YedYZ molybdopterin-dependent catalytic subunit
MNAIAEPRMLAINVQREAFDIYTILMRHPGGPPAADATIETVDDLTGSAGEPTSGATGEPPAPRRIGRGVFLVTVAGGLSSLWWGKAAWSSISSPVSKVADAVAPILPTGGWRIYTVAATMPVFDPATWRLKIGGMVAHPQELSYDELRALPQASRVRDFHCVTGWSVDGVHWRGVRFADLLAAAQPHPDAHALQFVSAEYPYVDYLTLEQAMLPDVMLAWQMDGKPLLQEHGAPVRVVIPEMYGYKNVKWVKEINLVRSSGIGYWEQYGYDNDAWVGRSNGYSSEQTPRPQRQRRLPTRPTEFQS